MTATASLSIGDRDGTAGGLRASLDRLRYRAQQYGLTLSLASRAACWSLVLSPASALDPCRLRACCSSATRRCSSAISTTSRAATTRASCSTSFRSSTICASVPEALVDVPRFLLRQLSRAATTTCRAAVDRSRYPRYYLRTFHWQTDGWLSERSARLYDFGVEFLFGGTADIMRRMAIPPVVDARARRRAAAHPRHRLRHGTLPAPAAAAPCRTRSSTGST